MKMKIEVSKINIGEIFKYQGNSYKRIKSALSCYERNIIVIAHYGSDDEIVTYFYNDNTMVEVDRTLTFADIKEGEKFYHPHIGLYLLKVKGIDGNMVAISDSHVYNMSEEIKVEST